jgi:hypothetical protein
MPTIVPIMKIILVVSSIISGRAGNSENSVMGSENPQHAIQKLVPFLRFQTIVSPGRRSSLRISRRCFGVNS